MTGAPIPRDILLVALCNVPQDAVPSLSSQPDTPPDLEAIGRELVACDFLNSAQKIAVMLALLGLSKSRDVALELRTVCQEWVTIRGVNEQARRAGRPADTST